MPHCLKDRGYAVRYMSGRPLAVGTWLEMLGHYVGSQASKRGGVFGARKCWGGSVELLVADMLSKRL